MPGRRTAAGRLTAALRARLTRPLRARLRGARLRGAGLTGALRRRLRGALGQATVELVALLPLLATVGLGVFQLLAAGAAHEVADAAAEAGAVAVLQDRDPRRAVRASLPDWSQDQSTMVVRGRRIRVEVRPRGPIGALTRRLVAVAAADAGPEPAS